MICVAGIGLEKTLDARGGLRRHREESKALSSSPTRKLVSGLLATVSLALACLGACLGCRKPDGDETFRHHTLLEWVSYDAFPHQENTRPPLDELILYVDASKSMGGYTDPAGQFEYSRALRAVRNVGDQLSPKHALFLRRMDAGITPLPTHEQTFLTLSRSARFYNGVSSNIAGTLRSYSDSASENQPRCHVLFTDGVQHVSLANQDSHCAAGSDPRCVNEAVNALLDKGWGLHIFGIRSRFDGPIYSEAARHWLGRYSAGSAAGHSSYRPFLIFVLTREGEYLEQLVDKLRDALLKSGIHRDLIRELPLSLPLVKSSRLDLNTDIYSIKDSLRADELLPNPLIHRTDGTWREDFDGTPLPERVQILEYIYEDIDFLQPFVAHVSAAIDLTTAGEIFFGKTSVDAGSLLKPLTVQEVARPRLWYAEPAKKPAVTEPPRGSGGLPASDPPAAAGNETPPTSDNEEELAPALAWPPPQSELKHLQFEAALSAQVPDFLEVNTEAGQASPPCPPNSGCHLVFRWSQSGDYLPITLVRIDGLLDPARIQLPTWVEEWSTEDDSRLTSANQLYNLDGLVRGLQDNRHIAKQGLRPWYLVIWPTKR